MNNAKINPTEIKQNIETKLSRYFGCTAAEASAEQMYKAVDTALRIFFSRREASSATRQRNPERRRYTISAWSSS